MEIKNYIFIFVLLTAAISVECKEILDTSIFDIVLESVESNQYMLGELIKNGAPAALATDIPKEVKKEITGVSYDPKCISLDQLSLIKIVHYGFDDKYHVGRMIVHKKVAPGVVRIFTKLAKAKYPIEKIDLIDKYNANDEASMNANNSSALCCRLITGSKTKWSKHSYGIAIDINPLYNPYYKQSKSLISPFKGAPFLDRTKNVKGLIFKDDVCCKAFEEEGWEWGGDWMPDTEIWEPNERVDYQHFEIKIDL